MNIDAVRKAMRVEKGTVVGTLDCGAARIATGTMGYKHRDADHAAVLKPLAQPNRMIKIMPDVDCRARVCELVDCKLEHVKLKGAWQGPCALERLASVAWCTTISNVEPQATVLKVNPDEAPR